jgi:CRISPR/Cas system type I-B associated protein Csh2 (Cas7 group RAMP superfamily)
MGEKLAEIYKIVEEKGGINGRMKLATSTGLPKKDASEMKDKPEIVEKFKNVASAILDCNIEEFLQK